MRRLSFFFGFVLVIAFQSTQGFAQSQQATDYGDPSPPATQQSATTVDSSQILKQADSIAKAQQPDEPVTPPDLTNVLVLDYFASIDGVNYLNPRTDVEHNNLYFYTSFTFTDILTTPWATLRTFFSGEYGARSYTDSTTIKATDGYEYRVNLDIPILHSKIIKGQFGVNVKSQFFKTFTVDDSVYRKHLYTDYFSPGYIIYTGGVNVRFFKNSTIDIGIVGAKTTRIKREEIYTERATDMLYGIKKGERKKTDYGLNLVLNIPPRKFGKHIGWSCGGQLFAKHKALGRLPSYTFSAKNELHYIFFKNMRLTLGSSILYDEAINNKVYMFNHLALGFYLSNAL